MATISYVNTKGARRTTIVPDLEEVDPAVVLLGSIKRAIADSAPIGAIRLMTTDEARAEFNAERKARTEERKATKAGARKPGASNS